MAFPPIYKDNENDLIILHIACFKNIYWFLQGMKLKLFHATVLP